MILAALTLLATLTSSDAVAVLLNSRNAVSAKTYAEAQGIVLKEAQAGRPLQQFVIGVTADDEKLAKTYLDASRHRIKALAIEKNNPLAWYLLSMEKNDMRCLRKAAEGGNVQALNALGTIELQAALSRKDLPSNEVARVLARSYDCFHQAAFKRDPNGLVNLGSCYLCGYGCRQDAGLAFRFFKAAAEEGHPEGMENLASCYELGRGVNRDNEQYLLWTMRARAARGDAAAEKWLRERK